MLISNKEYNKKYYTNKEWYELINEILTYEALSVQIVNKSAKEYHFPDKISVVVNSRAIIINDNNKCITLASIHKSRVDRIYHSLSMIRFRSGLYTDITLPKY